MNELTIEWQEGGKKRSHTIGDRQLSKNPGTVRIGRDPLKCDIVISEPTVSGLHIEIFFDAAKNQYSLRNLRESNPPVIDGQTLIAGEIILNQGSIIYLGQLSLKVVAISLASTPAIPPTVIVPPKPSQPSPPPQSQPAYGLQCPHCRRISPFERLDVGCQWCGTSLAAAVSMLIAPNRI